MARERTVRSGKSTSTRGEFFSSKSASADGSDSNSASSSMSELNDIGKLREFYRQYPDPEFSESAENAVEALKAAACQLSVRPKLPLDCPPGMDHGMFEARCNCEEGEEALQKLMDLGVGGGGGEKLEEVLEAVSTTRKKYEELQDRQRENTTKVIEAFLPNDFRKRLFKREKKQREKKNEDELKACFANGGCVRDKYELLWSQQNARREMLGSIGNASGLFRMLIATLSGVPDGLLRVARDLNKPGGPTEAIREKFHPTLTRIVHFAGYIANTANAVLNSVQGRIGAVGSARANVVLNDAEKAALDQVSRSSTVLLGEVIRFTNLLDKVIKESPFTINPENVGKLVGK